MGMLLLTTLVPLTLALFSAILIGTLYSLATGLLLLGGFFLAVGLLPRLSPKTRLWAAFSFGLLLMCWLLGRTGRARSGRHARRTSRLYLSFHGAL